MRALLISLTSLLSMQIIVSLATFTAAVLAPAAANDFGVSPQLISIYACIMFLCAAASGLASGAFVVHFGPLRVSQSCLVFGAAGLLVGTIATPLCAMLSAALLGLGLGPATPASSHSIMRVTPAKWLNIVFSIRQTGVPVGTALAGLILPTLAVLYGWRGAALGVALCSLAVAFALQPLRAEFDAGRDPTRSLGISSQLMAPLKLVFGDPNIRNYVTASFFYNGLQSCLATYLVTFLTERVDMTLVQAGFLLGVAQAAAAIARIAFGAAADYLWAPRPLLGVLGIAMALSGVATGLFAPDWPFGVIVVIVTIFGATSTGWNGVMVAQTARLAPPGRVSESLGGSAFSGFTGVALLPGLFGVLLTVSGNYALCFGVMALPPFLAGLWLLLGASAADRKLDR